MIRFARCERELVTYCFLLEGCGILATELSYEFQTESRKREPPEYAKKFQIILSLLEATPIWKAGGSFTIIFHKVTIQNCAERTLGAGLIFFLIPVFLM